jgi:hypothetical protein
MTTTNKSVLEGVIATLNDEGHVGWTVRNLARYLNDGQRDMHLRRPDLFNVKTTIDLVAGVSQRVPADGSKLIRVIRNDTSGSKVAVTPVDLEQIDYIEPGWRGAAGEAEIQHFDFDVRDPKFFDVYPPATTSAKLAIEYAQIPTDMTLPAVDADIDDITGDVGIPDLLKTALFYYIVFRAYSEENEFANADRAAIAQNLYAQDLGLEVSATVSVAPTKE